jgi:hypothetical protein
MILLAIFLISILATGACLTTLVAYALKAKSIIPLDSQLRRKKSLYLRLHVYWVKWFCVMTAMSVFFVELIVIDNHGRWGPDWLTYAHLVLITIGTILLFLTLYFNGRKSKQVHTKIVYVFLFFFTLMLISGLWLFLKHPLLFGT